MMDETTFSSGSMYSSGEEELLASEGLRLSRSTRWRERSRHVSYEPAMLLFCFALSLSDTELTHQVMYQTCRLQGFERHDCLLVGTDATPPGVEEIEALVKPAAASVTMVIVVIKSVIPGFGALWLGAWSDRHGRKPVVVITSCGLLLTYFVHTGLNFVSSFVQLNPWYYVAAYVPFAVPGGMVVIGAAVFASLADVTNDHNRTFRMGFMKAAMLAGSLAGSFSSRYILEWTGDTTLFVIATACVLVGVIYTGLYVEDSIIPSSDSELGSSLVELFSTRSIEDIVQTASRKRARYVWWILSLVIGCLTLMELAAGYNLVEFTFTRHRFDWSLKQYSRFWAVENGLVVLANILGVWALKSLFDCIDTLVALVSIISAVVCATIKAFAVDGWQMYLATEISFLRGMEMVALLSVCAYFVPSNEIGKLYALIFSVVGLVTLTSGPAFGFIYESTVGRIPEFYNFAVAGICGGAFVMLGFLQWLVNRRNQPELLL
ncbi:proton-coupled folate transporter-like isoform X2 [Topomyia yanbarensis]|uniref:proton-coupled folate transporter-like isoform X2 n=1 Tax=Topomyia yanbarensis TaxID=2498891 RepID=UPI00273AFCC9|nr:proton-coupled folate transporter-like isoform X2 [Topomyia yanbarensis]